MTTINNYNVFPRELVYDVLDLELVKPLSSVTVSDVGVDRKGGSYETSRAFSESAPAINSKSCEVASFQGS